MFRKWNRILAFLLSLALVTTTFGSDLATATAYAVEDGQELKERSGEEIFENANLDDLLDDENGEDVQKTSDDQKGEGKPAEGQQNVQNGDQPAESQQNDQQGDDEQLDETAQNPEELTSATDDNEEDEDETKEPEYEFEFNQSQVVNGIEVSLWAAKEVLPDDAVLSVEAVSEKEEAQIKELIDDETGKDVTVEKTISFDISINAPSMETEENPSGKVQPKEGTVAVTFSSVEDVSEGNIDVYHVADDGESAEKVDGVDVDVEEETVSFDASHFSKYTIVLKSGNTNRVRFAVEVVDDANNKIGTDSEITRAFEPNTTYTVDDIKSNVHGIDTNRYKYFETLVDTGRNNSPRWKKVDSFYADTYTELFVFTHYRLSAVVGNVKYDVDDHKIRFVYMDKTATVPVAVYASDGTNSTRVNEGLKDKLGLYYVEANSPTGGGNGYYPVGVVNLPRALVYEGIATTGSDNKKIFTNDNGDMQNLKEALLEATWSTDQLKRDDNKGNTVLKPGNIDYIQFEASDAGSDMANHRTTLMSWPDWYNEEGLNGKYGYHLDLRFATNIMTFKGVYYEDGQQKGNIENIAKKGYLKDQTATISDATKTAQDCLPEGYSVSGLYTNADCADVHKFVDTTLSQDTTIYVKYSKVNTYHIRYYGGANGVTGSVPEQTYTYGESPVTIQGNVGANGGTGFVYANHKFTGWNTKADGSGTPYTPGVSKYNTTSDLNLYAQWKPYTRITIAPKNVSKTYNGQPLSADYDVTGLDTAVYKIQGSIGYSVSSITDVNDSTTYTITDTSKVKIVKKSGNKDVTDEFEIVKSTGSANITVKPAEIYIETAGDEKEYDGVALTKNVATVKGLVNNESASIAAVGSQLVVGESPNNYEKNGEVAAISWGSVKASNYKHNKQKDRIGTLTVKQNTKANITISVPSFAKIYDGESYSVTSSDVSIKVTKKDSEGKDVTLDNFSLANVTLQKVGSNDTASTSISVQDAGAVTYQVASYKIVENSNPDVDVKEYFANKNITNGTLTVYPKTVIFTSAGYGTPVTKTYDGSPLTSEVVTIEVPKTGAYDTNGNLIAGTNELATDNTHPFTATATGKVTYPDDGDNNDGTVTNSIVVTQPDSTNLNNYNIIKHEGTLKVTNVPDNEKATFILQVGHAEGTYTGQPLSVTGFIPTENSDSNDGTKFTWNGHVYKVDGLTVDASETDVKVMKTQDGKPIKTENGWDVDTYTVSATGEAEIYAVEVVEGQETYRNVTSQFKTPEVLPGYIKINPVPVTISSSTWTQTYDGKALNNATGLAKAKADDKIDENDNYGVTITGSFANGEEENISYEFDASQTLPGSTKNTFSVVWGNVKETNYNVELVPGDLIVENRNAKFKIKVVAGSKDFNYDGQNHSVDNFDNKFGDLLLINEENGETTESRLTYTENSDGSISFTLGDVNYVITGLDISTPSKSYKHVFKNPDTKEVLPYTVSVDGTAVIKQEGFDTPVTDQFTVERGTGSLTIYPRYITARSASYTKEYDGTPLNNQWLIDNEKSFNKDNVIEIVSTKDIPEGRATGLVFGEGFVFYEVFGGQTNIGGEQHNNTFKIGVDIDTTRQDDYEITPEYGTLTVTGREKNYVINVKAASKLNEQYTGQPISVTDFDESDYRDVEVIKDENGSVTKLKYTAESGAVFYVTGLSVNTSEKDVKASRKNWWGNWIVESYSVPVNGLKDVVVTDESGNPVPSQSEIFTINSISGELKINPLNVTLTSNTWDKEYDGEYLTNASAIAKEIAENPERAEELNKTQGVTAVGFVEGEGATYKNFTGKSLLAGKSADNTFEYVLKDGTKATNYNIHKTYGKLTVKNRTDKYKITVEANSGEVKYDGHSYYVSGFKTLNFTVDGHTYKVGHLSANSGIHSNVKRGADGKTVEAYTSYIIGRERVYDQYNNDVTGQFEVTKVPGTLKIKPRQITLTSATDSKEYDGTALINRNVTVSGDGFVWLQGLFIRVTGTQTLVASSDNTFTYFPWLGTLLSNYDITKTYGTLTVTNRDAKYKLSVIANSKEVVYDGTEQTVSGFEGVKINNGRVDRKYATAADGTLYFMLNGKKFTVSGYDMPQASATDVVLKKTYEGDVLVSAEEIEAATAGVVGTPVVRDEKGHDVSAQFAVTPEAGKLIIKRRRVKIVAGSDEQEFNGNPLTCSDYEIVTGEGIEGFAVYTKNGATVNERDGVIIETSGSALRPEDSPATNHISVVFDEKIAKADNYIVTTVDGALTINSPSSKIMLDITLKVDGGNQKEVTYNGKQQSMDVTIGITPKKVTETEETQTTTEGGNTETPSPITQNSDDNDEGDASDLSAMIGKLMSLGTITVYAAEGEDIFEDVEQLKYNSTATFTYGNTTFVVSGITLEGGVGTDVGKYPVLINLDNLKVFVGKDVDGVVVADEKAPVNEFEFNVVKPETPAEGNNVVGVLNIVEKEITVTTGSASKDYDGDPLTSDVASIDGIVNGETYKITATGSRTDVGTSKNTYKIDWAGKGNDYTAKDTNYKVVKENLGDLRVDEVYSGGGGEDAPFFFTLAATAPAGEVLGAQRAVGEAPAVLGARRSSTDDNTNSMARVFVMVAATALVVTMIITGKKKDEEEEG